MKNFAVVDKGIVVNVIVADDDFAQMYSASPDHIGECFEYKESDPDDTKVARIGEAYINGLFVNGNQAVDLGLLTVDQAKNYGFHSGQEYKEPVRHTVVTMRQARLALLDIGIRDTDVRVVIATLPSPMDEQALIEWDYANEVDRLNPLIGMLMSALGLSEADIEALFLNASTK